MMTAEQKIVQVLGGFDEASSAEIARFFLLPWNMWSALLRLERSGVIHSRWESAGINGPWRARRRLYRLAVSLTEAKARVAMRIPREDGTERSAP